MAAPPPFTSASTLLASSPLRKLPLGDACLDALFGGGLPLSGLVELAGEAGSGKTAFAMQIALRASAASGLASLIINTEGPFPAARLVDMARAMGSPRAGADLTELVKIADIADAPALEAYLEALPRAATANRIGFVVVDSIASPLRADLGGAADAPERVRALLAVASALLALNADAGVGVVVCNQVADVVEERDGGVAGALGAAAAAGVRVLARRSAALSSGRWVRPALGPAWDAAVTHRLLLTRPVSDSTAAAAAREVHVIKSPLVPVRSVSVALCDRGLIGTAMPHDVV